MEMQQAINCKGKYMDGEMVAKTLNKYNIYVNFFRGMLIGMLGMDIWYAHFLIIRNICIIFFINRVFSTIFNIMKLFCLV